MRAIDTNIVVRFLTGDHPQQARMARAVIDQGPVFMSRTVVLEAEWVVCGVYELPPARVIAALHAFAGLPGVVIEDAASVARAMGWAEAGMDFANALHLAAASARQDFLTFDQRFVRKGSTLTNAPPVTLA